MGHSWNDCWIRVYGNYPTKYSHFLCSHISFIPYHYSSCVYEGKPTVKNQRKVYNAKKKKREKCQHTQKKYQLINASDGN